MCETQTRYDSVGVQREVNSGFSKMIWRTIDRYLQRQYKLGKQVNEVNIKTTNTSRQVLIDINNSEYRTAFEYKTSTDLNLKYISMNGIEYLMLESENIN